ncbi:MAG: hypothetical protein J5872_02475 [Lachnospiraceae bacterium]|nr:hypothetical protein [Lachnospiraceae bacterium]
MNAEEQLKETMSREHLSADAKERILAACRNVSEPVKTAPAKPFYMRPLFLSVTSCAAVCAVILLIVLAAATNGETLKKGDRRTGAQPEVKSDSVNAEQSAAKDTDSLNVTVAALSPRAGQTADAEPKEEGALYYDYSGTISSFVPEQWEENPKARFVCFFPTDYETQKKLFVKVAEPLILDLVVEEKVYFVVDSVTEEDDGTIVVSGYRTERLGKTLGARDEADNSASPFEKKFFLRRFRMNPDTGNYELINE